MGADPEALRQRVREACLALPEVTERIENPLHSAFLVKDKTFCYFLNDHHGDGIVGITVKGGPGVQGALLDLDPARFYLPAYVARWGWVGMRLDVEPVDWAQVDQLIGEAWATTAPKSVLKRLNG